MICADHLQVTCGVALAVLKDVLAHIRRLLKKGGVKARLITSGTGDWRFLDIVSVRAGKLEVCRSAWLDIPTDRNLQHSAARFAKLAARRGTQAPIRQVCQP